MLILGGFWTTLLLAAVGVLGPPLDFAWPRRSASGFGGLDLFEIRVQDDGGLVVNTGAITKGSRDNPMRVVPYNPTPA